MRYGIRYFGFALFLAAFCGAETIAAPAPSAYERASDNLPLGLDRLRWGMTSEEVRRAYPELTFSADYGDFGYPSLGDPGAAWGPKTLSLDDYRHGGCAFRIAFSFYHARLYTVFAHSTNMDAALRDCRREVRREMTALYGSPPQQYGYPYWPGPVTKAQYDVPAFVGPAIPPPAPRPLNINFSDANDISGYAAAETLYQNSKCQSITVAFLPDIRNDGASTPVIAPRLHDLGCDYEYPTIAFRLQEQGTVVLDVRILADGSVGMAEVAIPDRSPRLNAAAIDVVQKAVTFLPAIKDGKHVETERQISVAFKLLHFITGRE